MENVSDSIRWEVLLLLSSNEECLLKIDKLKSDYFYGDTGKIFNTIKQLFLDGKKFNWKIVCTIAGVDSPPIESDPSMFDQYISILREAYSRYLTKETLSTLDIYNEPIINIKSTLTNLIENLSISDEVELSSTKNINKVIDEICTPSEKSLLRFGVQDLDECLYGLMPGEFFILAARPSQGKAQPLDMQIKTIDGWSEMGKLKIGDKIASTDGKESIVNGIYPQGVKKVFRITFSDGRSTESCDEHLWKIYSRHWELPRVLSTNKIIELLKSKRHRNRIWIEKSSGHFGHNDQLPIDPYILGALIGDGGFTNGTARFSNTDKEIIEKIRSRLPKWFELKKDSSKYSYSLVCKIPIICTETGQIFNSITEAAKFLGVTEQSISRTAHTGSRSHGKHYSFVYKNRANNTFSKLLDSLGLGGLKSKDKFIPKMYLLANYQARIDLLNGLMDTDGCVSPLGSLTFNTSSKKLAYDVLELIRSLGGQANLSKKIPTYTYKGEVRTGLLAYRLTLSHDDPRNLVSLRKKQERIFKRNRHKRLTIQSIEFSRITDTQCITVSHPNQLYIVEDYVVTHNSSLAQQLTLKNSYENNNTTLFFSMEDSEELILKRFISNLTGISFTKIFRNDIDNSDKQMIAGIVPRLQESPIYIKDSTSDLFEIISTSRKAKIKFPDLNLIVIDYIQLINSGQDTEYREISIASKALKVLAKELKVTVVCVSQLNRLCETRDDKHPMLSDLRGSGNLEQDADRILFLYRPYKYDGIQEHINIIEYMLSKNRHGETKNFVGQAFFHCFQFS